tara:strand:+ start:160 stop:579 length:420 start_codon:yes stop_codon:yes gene_type:complete
MILESTTQTATYQSIDLSSDNILGKLNQSTNSYQNIHMLCKYPPLNKLISETIEERKRLMNLLDLELPDTHRYFNTPSETLTWARTDENESLKQVDQGLINSMNYLVQYYPFTTSTSRKIRTFVSNLENHIEQVEAILE